ncbi:helicase-associated domain-containing protein [Catenuloplanes atrovinosus]|uniref:Helicase XPB/Ssl2 N-terminal domain-containing protein n=1 Tax=Catenuloplanes atrovinosus TaxID=137266 RepID=A0AAE3YV38_9ACTN|nr:helicase-associated domain-containing protein [Catenuloplanes atrovinosus]MDR7279145.1 hypothetical protein [Catenuloplanes atrovinosus]
MASPLVRWLAGRSPDQLARILLHRPESVHAGTGSRPAAPPSDLSALAERLQRPAALHAALRAQPLPSHELLGLLTHLGRRHRPVPRATLAHQLGLTADDPGLTAALDRLAAAALAWPDHEDGLHIPTELARAFPHPLGLGADAARLYRETPADRLRQIAVALGRPDPGPRRDDAYAAVRAALADAPAVRDLADTAPPEVRDLLHAMAAGLPVATPDPARSGAQDWAVSRGLLAFSGWRLEMPAEVATALRGPGWTPPFTPDPPLPKPVPVTADAVARESAAAAHAAVQHVTALLDAISATPAAALKTGGVGSRELTRLGKAIGVPAAEARFWLVLAHAAGLVDAVYDRSVGYGMDPTRYAVTGEHARWQRLSPARRLTALLRRWPTLAPAALATHRGGFGPAGAALAPHPLDAVAPRLKTGLLDLLAALPDGAGLPAPFAAGPAVGWHRPLDTPVTGDRDELVVQLWEEARLCGVIAHGTLTPLGRALLADDRSGLDRVADGLLPDAVATALFQNDLTVVVPGIPAADLATLLDACADRESRGGAGTWRFSAASVRRALDDGHRAEDLRAALAAVGTLPQALDYLIADVARRHGHVRVRPAGCVLHTEDPALIAEILSTRGLAALGLTTVAPTVLVSPAGVTETLAALRAAGFAPAGEDADGGPLVRQRPPAATAAPEADAGPDTDAGPPAARELTPADALHLAKLLLTAARPADPVEEARQRIAALRPRNRAADEDITLHAERLDDAARATLAACVRERRTVHVEYVNAGGRRYTRLVEPLAVDGEFLVGQVPPLAEEVSFALGRIVSVTPA